MIDRQISPLLQGWKDLNIWINIQYTQYVFISKKTYLSSAYWMYISIWKDRKTKKILYKKKKHCSSKEGHVSELSRGNNLWWNTFCTKQNPGDFAFLKSNFSSQYDSPRYYINEKGKNWEQGRLLSEGNCCTKSDKYSGGPKNRMNSKSRN